MAAGEGARLAAMLAAGRRRLFVGRVHEQDTFRQALRRDGAVLFVHGPGGVGKTTLLDVCADIAASEGRPVRRLDGRDVEPSPPGVLAGSATKWCPAPCC